MKILILDAYNLIHRAMGAFKGNEDNDYACTFNFIRGLKVFFEKFKPDMAYFVLEGMPIARKQQFNEYKANRKKPNELFEKNKLQILDIMKFLPIITAKHDSYEADDIIYSIAQEFVNINNHDVIIISTDSDFTQILQIKKSINSNINVYNWRKKQFVTPPEYNYVLWKALKGDKTDNIPRVGNITEMKAERIVKSSSMLSALLKDDSYKQQLIRNIKLIKLKKLSNEEMFNINYSIGKLDTSSLSLKFLDLGLPSIAKSDYIEKLARIFSCCDK